MRTVIAIDELTYKTVQLPLAVGDDPRAALDIYQDIHQTVYTLLGVEDD